MLPIYSGKEIFISESNETKVFPVIDDYISIRKDHSVELKLKILIDAVSSMQFNGLHIELQSLDSQGIAHLNMKENYNYSGPTSLPKFQSWFSYFQGSSGGLNTMITLKESILQKSYNNDWINGVIFYYQGKEFGEWDHVHLNGLIKRYE